MGDLVQILQGDCQETLRALPDESVHCVATSPPYWALRDYGTEPLEWPACSYVPMVAGAMPPIAVPPMSCALGLEPDLDAFIGHMVLVMREVRRVLRRDGVMWLNFGDVYAFGGRGGNPGHSPHTKQKRNAGSITVRGLRPHAAGLRPKDLFGIPWRVAFALQADGWCLRSDCVWSKPTAMPESVLDRPSRSHEYVFLFSKSRRYFYDADAVRTPLAAKTRSTFGSERSAKDGADARFVASHGWSERTPERKPRTNADGTESGANLRTVWTIATRPYPGAHFATFPPALAERCILAGWSAYGCCAVCSAPWRRVTKVSRRVTTGGSTRSIAKVRAQQGESGAFATGSWNVVGWEPSCKCGVSERVPCTVLDPFGGSGTTPMVAAQNGRAAIVCELSAEYVELQRERLGIFAPVRRASAGGER